MTSSNPNALSIMKNLYFPSSLRANFFSSLLVVWMHTHTKAQSISKFLLRMNKSYTYCHKFKLKRYGIEWLVSLRHVKWKEQHHGALRIGSITWLIVGQTPSMRTISPMNAREAKSSRPDLREVCRPHPLLGSRRFGCWSQASPCGMYGKHVA